MSACKIEEFRAARDRFFAPLDYEPPDHWWGTLQVARRDVRECCKRGLNWPCLMVIVATLDLLSRLYFGTFEHKDMEERFREFTKTHCFPSLSKGKAEDRARWLVKLRHALVHCFGWYAWDFGENGERIEYKFRVFPTLDTAIERDRSDRRLFRVGLEPLRAVLDDAATRYERELEQSDELRDKFMKLYPYIGRIRMGPELE